MKTLYESRLNTHTAPALRRTSLGATLVKLTRPASLILAILVATLSPVAIPRAMAQTVATPNGGFISFDLAPGASTAPITLLPSSPWHVTGSVFGTLSGVGEVDIENVVDNYLQWVGTGSSGTITAGNAMGSGTNIISIDGFSYVNLVTSSADSFIVTNSSSNPSTVTGYVTWMGYSNAISSLQNTALGADALFSTTTGSDNTASGYEALYFATTADYNTASGYQALYKSNAVSNTASGYQALYDDTSGAENTAMGVHALQDNSSGSSNIGIGYHGGINLTTGSNNIDIGSPGMAGESGAIRIGTITGITSTQSATYIAGIYGKASSGGLPVLIDSNGLLGTTTSSARFKTAIEPMGSNTVKLQQLRPVTFHLKSDPTGAVQYGLIAEEVARIYPELVVRDANGRIDGVRYDELTPMLLNEMQQEQKAARARAAAQDAKIEKLERQLLAMQAAVARAQGSGELVTGR
jgi:polyhydroxyalkanoate synthesis regulator phasin